eukprot:gene202-266_t
MYALPTLAKVEPHPQAKNVLSCIKKTNCFQADVVYKKQEKDPQAAVVVVQGSIWVKGDQYKIIWAEQEIFCNGETMWRYLPELQEVYIHDLQSEEVPLMYPCQLLRLHEYGFIPVNLQTVRAKDQEITSEIVTLIASEEDHAIQQLKLFIDSNKHQIKNIDALDSHGVMHHFEMKNFVPMIEIADSEFEFEIEKYKGLEVVDLR